MDDSGASLDMMELSSLKSKVNNTIRQSCKIMDIQTAQVIVASNTQANFYIKELAFFMGAFGGRFSGSAIVWKTAIRAKLMTVFFLFWR